MPARRKTSVEENIDGNVCDLSLMNLKEVPSKAIALHRDVDFLDLSSNRLMFLRKNFCNLTNLVELRLDRNRIKKLPEQFGKLRHLKSLDLYGNRLHNLPSSFGKLKNLRYLDLGNNPLNIKLGLVVTKAMASNGLEACAIDVVKYIAELQAEANRARRQQFMKRNNPRSPMDHNRLNVLRQRVLFQLNTPSEVSLSETSFEDELDLGALGLPGAVDYSTPKLASESVDYTAPTPAPAPVPEVPSSQDAIHRPVANILEIKGTVLYLFALVGFLVIFNALIIYLMLKNPYVLRENIHSLPSGIRDWLKGTTESSQLHNSTSDANINDEH